MRVPREPFIEAYERSGLPANEVALRIGMTRKRRGRAEGDSTSLLRLLGLAPDVSRGYRSFRPRDGDIDYDLGVRLARALDVDPVDLGV